MTISQLFDDLSNELEGLNAGPEVASKLATLRSLMTTSTTSFSSSRGLPTEVWMTRFFDTTSPELGALSSFSKVAPLCEDKSDITFLKGRLLYCSMKYNFHYAVKGDNIIYLGRKVA